MANLRDRVKVTTATTGTGTITLGAAVPGYRTFASAYTVDRPVSYAIEDGTAWETGVGTYSTASNTLTRTLDASSTGALVNLSGTATVGIAYLSRDHIPDWPFAEATFSGNVAAANSTFTDMPLSSKGVDTHNALTIGTNPRFVIPTGHAGVYDISAGIRFNDSGAANESYLFGVGTSATDVPTSTWGSTNGIREGRQYRRLSMFNVGDSLRPYYFIQSGARSIVAGYFSIQRVL